MQQYLRVGLSRGPGELSMIDTSALLQTVRLLAMRTSLPEGRELAEVFSEAAGVLENLPVLERPRASDGRAGGLVELDALLPTLILPDLHARPSLLLDLLETTIPDTGVLVVDGLARQEIQVLMLGDGPHTEGPLAKPRWQKAWEEFQTDWKTSSAMKEEMTLAFNAMEMVARLISVFPGHFFFLKGNHDNILNQDGGGNHSFGKYAYEGLMAFLWTQDFLGEEFLSAYDGFERALPLVARGRGFLATHAEPAFAITVTDAVEARLRPEIIEALTWTANDAADPEAVDSTLAAFVDPADLPGLAFGGHRPVHNRFSLRSEGRFVQIHDVDHHQAALVFPGQSFDPVTGIIDLGKTDAAAER